MYTITSINKNKGQYDIYINDNFSFQIPENEYLKTGLYEKSQLTDEEYRNILYTSVFSKAKKIGLNYIAFKMRTAEEVKNKLVLRKLMKILLKKQ